MTAPRRGGAPGAKGLNGPPGKAGKDGSEGRRGGAIGIPDVGKDGSAARGAPGSGIDEGRPDSGAPSEAGGSPGSAAATGGLDSGAEGVDAGCGAGGDGGSAASTELGTDSEPAWTERVESAFSGAIDTGATFESATCSPSPSGRGRTQSVAPHFRHFIRIVLPPTFSSATWYFAEQLKQLNRIRLGFGEGQ